MSTHYTHEDFVALAVGDLWFGQVVRLRLHLAGCADCRTEYAKTAQLMAIAQELQTQTVPDALYSRIQAQMHTTSANLSIENIALDTSDKQAILTQGVAVAPDRIRRQTEEPRKLRGNALLSVRAWALAACLLLFMIGINRLPKQNPNSPLNSPNNAGVAFAAVREAMQRVKSIHFVAAQTSSDNSRDQQVWGEPASSQGLWVRVHPFALALQSPDGVRHLKTTSGEVTYDPRTQKTEFDAYNPADIELLDFLLAPVSPDKPFTKALKWSSHRVTENGRAEIRYDAVETYEPTKGMKAITERRVWADPKTYLVIHSEIALTTYDDNKQTDWVKVSLDRFRYNEPLPHELFDLPAPSANASHKKWEVGK